MVAPKAEIPLYHQNREHGRPSFSRRKRASAGSKRRSGGNAMWWWMVIISPLVLVAFCLGTFLGIELARAPTSKDTALIQGMCTEDWPLGPGALARNSRVREVSRSTLGSVRPIPNFLHISVPRVWSFRGLGSSMSCFTDSLILSRVHIPRACEHSQRPAARGHLLIYSSSLQRTTSVLPSSPRWCACREHCSLYCLRYMPYATLQIFR